MAKNWTYNEETGILARNYSEKRIVDEKETVVETAPELLIDMSLLYDNWVSFDEVQVACAVNGMKQKLDDATARSKAEKLTDPEKREVQEALRDRILDDRKWNMAAVGGKRGQSVSLKILVPALLEAGLSNEAIATATKKSLAEIEKFIETGEETE